MLKILKIEAHILPSLFLLGDEELHLGGASVTATGWSRGIVIGSWKPGQSCDWCEGDLCCLLSGDGSAGRERDYE